MCFGNVFSRVRGDGGFMGFTHGLSGVAALAVLFALFPAFMFDSFLGSRDFLIVLSAFVVVVGAAFVPDFDNTRSTAISSFGVVGRLVSGLMRSVATGVFVLLHSRYDGREANPHRGFWHTGVACVLLGVLVWLSTSVGYSFSVPVLGRVSVGFLFCVFWVWVCLRLAVRGLLGKLFSSLRSSRFGVRFGVELACLVLPVLLVWFSGSGSYGWVGACFGLGCLIHVLGDACTVSGAPLLFPVPVRGKLWWDVRFFPFEAGGWVERCVFVPVFGVLAVAGLLKMVLFVLGVV